MADLPSWPELTITANGAIAEVRMNREARRNALSVSLMGELTEAALALGRRTDIHAVILTGAATYFSAGADLSDPARTEGRATLIEQREAARLGPDLCAAWEAMEQVTIAAVEGYCIGGASALALACDFRIAGAGAYFRLPEIALGMNMSWRTLPRLAALVGPARAKRYVIFCEPCPAEQALEWGMIDVLTPTGGALAEARVWADKVAALPPLPVRMSKEAINAASMPNAAATTFMDRDQWLLTRTSQDFAEGTRAFLEKRKPVFRGD